MNTYEKISLIALMISLISLAFSFLTFLFDYYVKLAEMRRDLIDRFVDIQAASRRVLRSVHLAKTLADKLQDAEFHGNVSIEDEVIQTIEIAEKQIRDVVHMNTRKLLSIYPIAYAKAKDLATRTHEHAADISNEVRDRAEQNGGGNSTALCASP